MATQTFPCPFCGRKMGVGVELLGRHVRCPNPQCAQKVLAPAASSVAAATPPKPAVSAPTPGDLPVFNLPKPDAPDSIFGEAEDGGDDLFGETPAARKPEMPPSEPGLPGHIPVVSVAPVPVPVVAVPAAPAPVAAAPAEAESWTGFEPATPEAPESRGRRTAESDDELAAEEPPPRPRQPRPTARPQARPSGGPGTLIKVGFFLLLPYALVMTGLAAYGLFVKSGSGGSAPEAHPLSTVPDNFGEFPASERRKVSKAPFNLEGELPAELKVALGGKLTVGAVEIEPTKVEVRKLRVVRQGKNAKDRTEQPLGPAVTLKMTITNTSDDVTLYPLDPAFNRRVTAVRPATGLAVGRQVYWGGAIPWPFDARTEREYEKAQEQDATPLAPRESREYVVFTSPDPGIVKSVQQAKEPLLWRVQVRRGFVSYKGKDVPVSAIVGVEFQASDVQPAE